MRVARLQTAVTDFPRNAVLECLRNIPGHGFDELAAEERVGCQHNQQFEFLAVNLTGLGAVI